MFVLLYFIYSVSAHLLLKFVLSVWWCSWVQNLPVPLFFLAVLPLSLRVSRSLDLMTRALCDVSWRRHEHSNSHTQTYTLQRHVMRLGMKQETVTQTEIVNSACLNWSGVKELLRQKLWALRTECFVGGIHNHSSSERRESELQWSDLICLLKRHYEVLDKKFKFIIWTLIVWILLKH